MTKMDKFRIGISAMVISSTVLAVGIPVIAYIANQPQKLNTNLESFFQNTIINENNKYTFDDLKTYIKKNEKDIKISLANQLKTIPSKITELRLEETGELVFHFQPKKDQNMTYESSENVTIEEGVYNGVTLYVVTVRNLKFYDDVVTKSNLKSIWSRVNNTIIEKNITIAKNAQDANYDQLKGEIIDVISKTSLTGGKKIEKYWDKNIIRNFNSISFKLSSELFSKDGFTKFSNFNLNDGDITLDEDGTIFLNNLSFSSPSKYFRLNESKDTLIELTPESLEETDILIPHGVKKLANFGVFYNNEKIEKLFLPDTLVELPTMAFEKTKKLEYVRLSRSLKELPENAFLESKVKKVKWYRSLNSVGRYAFFNSQLEGDIILPSGIKTIKKGTFQFDDKNNQPLLNKNNQPLLTSITTWANIFDVNAFSGQLNLKRINLMSDTIDPFYDVDWNAFSKIPATTKIYVKSDLIKKELINKCITTNIPEEEFTMISEDQIIVDENLDSILEN